MRTIATKRRDASIARSMSRPRATCMRFVASDDQIIREIRISGNAA